MVLADTAFCIISLKYYSFYLIMYHMISFVIPSLYQVVTSVNQTYLHIHSHLSAIYRCFLWRRFCFCSINRRQTLGKEFRWFDHVWGRFCCCDITGNVNLFSFHHHKLDEPHNSVTAQDTKCPLWSSRRRTLLSCSGIVNVFFCALVYGHKNKLQQKKFHSLLNVIN